MPVKIKSTLGSVTLAAENVSGDTTLTVPSGTGTVATTADLPTSIVDNGNATAITIDANENVGIGTASPNTKLHIDHSGNKANAIRVGDLTTIGSDTGIYFRTTGNAYISTASTGDHVFDKAGTERMRIDSSGGLILSPAVAANPKLIQNCSNNTKAVSFRSAGVERGNIYFLDSGVSYNTTSDYRLKENIVPMTGSIDRLKALNPSRFNFIADPDITVDGFLAHEAQEVVPEAVTGTKDAMRTEEYEVTPAVLDDDGNVVTEAVMGEREVEDYQGIDQSKLSPLIVGALQEAIAKIESLEAEVALLKGN